MRITQKALRVGHGGCYRHSDEPISSAPKYAEATFKWPFSPHPVPPAPLDEIHAPHHTVIGIGQAPSIDKITPHTMQEHAP